MNRKKSTSEENVDFKIKGSIKCGYIHKAPQNKSNSFQKRFFVLSPGLLTYFKQVAGRTAGVIDLSKVEEVKETVTKPFKFGFSIRIPARTYQMYVPTAQERLEWIGVIQSQVDSSKSDNSQNQIEEVFPEAENWYSKDPASDLSANFLQSEELQILVNTSFNVNPTRFFYMFWSDKSHEFLKSYHCDVRSDSKLQIEKWQAKPELGFSRSVKYVTQAKIGGVGASTGNLEEIQRYILTKDKLVIEIKSRLTNIPLAESFEIESRWEAVSCGINKCMVTACGATHFNKSIILKKQIMNSSINQTRNSYGKWVILAKDAVAALPPSVMSPLVRDSSAGKVNNTAPGTSGTQEGARSQGGKEPASPTNNQLPLSIILPGAGVLLVLMAVLYSLV